MVKSIQVIVLFLLVGLCWYFVDADEKGEERLGKSSLVWKKHVVMAKGMNHTAVAVDVNGDKQLDVITSYDGRVSLFIAPNWEEEIVIYEFQNETVKSKSRAIHSVLLDVDGDGDLDWVGALPHGNPIWLENPGVGGYKRVWKDRIIDSEWTAIHCLTVADIDNDGVDDLIINNFAPDKGVADSIAWFKIPERPLTAKQWKRNVFAKGDAVGGSHYMGVVDIDGDGWREIAVGAKGKPFKGGNWFGYWKNPGEKAVQGAWEKVMLAENQEGATNILPADVNGDGKVDWVASRGHGMGVLWFENPSWKEHEIDTEIKSPHSLTVADYDSDGDLDIAACGFESQWVRWYESDGAGNFVIHTLDQNQQSYDLKSVGGGRAV